MNLGTEEFVAHVKHVKNEFDSEGTVTKPATRYLTMQERIDRENELQGIDEFLDQPPAIMRTLSVLPDRVRNLRIRRKQLRRELDNQSPPTDLTGEQKDAIYALQKEAVEKIQVGMLPVEDMLKSPVGAVDHNIKWLNTTKTWQLILKNCLRLLNPKSEDKDLANIERYRPRRYVPGGPGVVMGDAEVSNQFSYSHIPDEKWEAAGLPLVTPGSPLARKSAEELQQEIDELKVQLAAKDTPKVKAETKARAAKPKARGMSDEAKQRMRDMMNKRWAAKKAGQVQPAA